MRNGTSQVYFVIWSELMRSFSSVSNQRPRDESVKVKA